MVLSKEKTMDSKFSDYLEFIVKARELGAVEIVIGEASVKFTSPLIEPKASSIVNDLINLNKEKSIKEEEEEDVLYWSSNG